MGKCAVETSNLFVIGEDASDEGEHEEPEKVIFDPKVQMSNAGHALPQEEQDLAEMRLQDLADSRKQREQDLAKTRLQDLAGMKMQDLADSRPDQAVGRRGRD